MLARGNLPPGTSNPNNRRGMMMPSPSSTYGGVVPGSYNNNNLYHQTSRGGGANNNNNNKNNNPSVSGGGMIGGSPSPSSSASSSRTTYLRLILAIIGLTLLGYVIRERKMMRDLKSLKADSRERMQSAFKEIPRSFDYLSKKFNTWGGGGELSSREEEEEEEEEEDEETSEEEKHLFSVLSRLDKNVADEDVASLLASASLTPGGVGDTNAFSQTEMDDVHNNVEAVIRMMNEGVIEEPHVDVDETEDSVMFPSATATTTTASVASSSSAASGGNAMVSGDRIENDDEGDSTATSALSGGGSDESGETPPLPATLLTDQQLATLELPKPSHEEIMSGQVVVKEVLGKQGEQTDEEGEEEEEEGKASSSSIASNVHRVNGKVKSMYHAYVNEAGEIRLKPQVKGPKAYKMVNTHFLALMDAWTHAGWARLSDSAFLSSVTLLLTKPVTAIAGSRGKMISQISSSSCLGGSKGAQLSCRSKYSLKYGCRFDEDLGLSPRQYDMWRSKDCERFFELALRPENAATKQWIGKLGASYHGKHISIYKGVTKTIKTQFGKCKMNKEWGGGYILQEYVSDPALVGERKFDLRTFLLVASTEPFLVFYHGGFVRRSANKYSSDNLDNKLIHITNVDAQEGAAEDHFWGFPTLERALASELGFPSDYMRTTFRARTKHVTNFVFQAGRARFKRRAGSYMLFGLDWMIDARGGVHLLEGNGNPVVRHYPGTDDFTPQIWRDMAKLLTAIHYSPAKELPPGSVSTQSGFKMGGWELVFNELEEAVSGREYDPCRVLKGMKDRKDGGTEACSSAEVCEVW